MHSSYVHALFFYVAAYSAGGLALGKRLWDIHVCHRSTDSHPVGQENNVV